MPFTRFQGPQEPPSERYNTASARALSIRVSLSDMSLTCMPAVKCKSDYSACSLERQTPMYIRSHNSHYVPVRTSHEVH